MQLLKYSLTIGLPVVCANNGKKTGVIKDVIFNPSQRCITAFLLERKGIEIGRKQILFKDVLGIGREALIIDNEKAVTEYSKHDKKIIYSEEGCIIGLHVFGKSGYEIGVVADYAYDPGTGRIESVEISDGLLQDLVQGRHILPLFGKVEFGEENLIVEKEAIEEMVNNGRGIKNGLLS